MKKTIETASIKQDGDVDSDSSESAEDSYASSETSATKKPVTEQVTIANPQPELEPQPQTNNTFIGRPRKPRKPSKPSTIDCDRDHTVKVQDDKTITGVIVARSCHATRFVRKPRRFANVGNKLGALLNGRLMQKGIRGGLPMRIVQVAGNKQHTEFHYTVACEKSQQQIVIDQLKATCKDKDLVDVITNENQPDEDDSSSESSEDGDIKERGRHGGSKAGSSEGSSRLRGRSF